MSGIVREAIASDLDFIMKLLHQLSPPKGEEKSGEETFRRIAANPDYHLVVYAEGETILGTAMLFIQANLSHSGRPVGHIENVVSDASARGRGIGKRLMGHLYKAAEEANCYKVILNCTLENSLFYKNCGFEETGEIEMRANF